MKIKQFTGLLVTAFIASSLAVFVYSKWFQPSGSIQQIPVEQKILYANLPSELNEGAIDLTYAAEKTVHAVVHVKTKAMRTNTYSNPLYEHFFGDRAYGEPQPVIGFGSGVIISENGYIITNNHVIDKMDEVEVVLNDKRSFEATVIGTDPSTDLALLKIEEEGLSFLSYGNADNLKLGQWVLAVGNPYNLTSTVTAGIVSAKGRNISINSEQFAIESFIQTDAAVNPGNSGGALVNVNGELVGINTAIASRTGSYSGNSFAIPVSIVNKVISDLMEFGVVQRAILGVTIQDVTQELADENKISELNGVYINGVRDDGSAKEAGLKVGDIIISVDGHKVNSVSELQEQISRYRPKDKVNVIVSRDNNQKAYDVVLRNLDGNTNVIKKEQSYAFLGANFEVISMDEKKEMGLENGVKVVNLGPGKLMKAGVKEGFVITRINNKEVKKVEDVKNVIGQIKGGVYLEGVYANGMRAYYAFGI
ncbi:MAG: Do family serine endopeptidase [Bacteroidales bacterium]|nr:Do family serine endopeptidase [Bacteroidales bacterium]MCF8391800.1 Do family serine endopeptidase [Bacteroidales bacterium]